MYIRYFILSCFKLCFIDCGTPKIKVPKLAYQQTVEKKICYNNLHLLLWRELDLLNKEVKRPAPSDFAKAVFPTPQWPNRRTDNLTAGFEVGTSCLAKESRWPVARSLSRSSAMSLWPYLMAVMSALILSEFFTSMLQPAAHRHLKELFIMSRSCWQ